MGQAKITGGGPTGLYNIEIVKHAGKSVARLAAIAKRLTALGSFQPPLPGLIPIAQAAVDAAIIALDSAAATFDLAIKQRNISLSTLVATRVGVVRGNGTCDHIFPSLPRADIGIYFINCNDVGMLP